MNFQGKTRSEFKTIIEQTTFPWLRIWFITLTMHSRVHLEVQWTLTMCKVYNQYGMRIKGLFQVVLWKFIIWWCYETIVNNPVMSNLRILQNRKGTKNNVTSKIYIYTLIISYLVITFNSSLLVNWIIHFIFVEI